MSASLSPQQSNPRTTAPASWEALLVDALPGADYCRGYVQSWLQADRIPEASARLIFTAADRILRAGTPTAGKEE